MIEVEIRGQLNEKSYTTLRDILMQFGVHIEDQKREMILLYGYPGFDVDPLKRKVDIRLRNTNGNCEVMIKHTESEFNIARKEVSIPSGDNDWQKMINMVKAFGITKGLWMRREKEVFMFNNIEWSLAKAISRDGAKTFYYYEAENPTSDRLHVEEIKKNLEQEVKRLNLPIMSPKEYKAMVEMFGREVNEEITL